MAGKIRITQAGLSAGAIGRSRTDGLDTGATVTIENTGPGPTEFRLLWVPLGDTTAAASLAATVDPEIWEFEPTAECYGCYRIELIEAAGTPSEYREIRIFGVRTPNRQILIPAFNTKASKIASLENSGSDQVDASEDNSTDYTGALATLDYTGTWRALHELAMAVDNGAVPASGDTPGYLSRHVYAHEDSTMIGLEHLGVAVEEAPVWTTADQIPPGNLFHIVLFAAAPGGNGGDTTNALSNTASGGGAPGGGSFREGWFSRQDLIDALPITWALPLGGNGGTGATGSGNNVGTRGIAPSGPSTVGSLLIAYPGGRGAATALGTAEGGGGGGGEEGAGADGSSSNAGAGGAPFGGTGSGAGDNPSLFGGGSGGGSAVTNKGGDSRNGGSGGGQSKTGGTQPGAGGGSQHGGTGGGAGGGQSSGGVAASGGAGGPRLAPSQAGAIGGVAGGAKDGADGDPCTMTQGGMGGGGGAGAAGASPGQVGGHGGDGGFGGGGGGGGGGAASSGAGVNTAGNGGKGGDSAGILTAYS